MKNKAREHRNTELNLARARKRDEFFTPECLIEEEIPYYKDYLENATVLCNCNDGLTSSFFHYFLSHYEVLRLNKLVTTSFNPQGQAYKLITYKNEGTIKTEVQNLEGNGDFRSAELIELLKESDVICTNPPFSLFREYVGQLNSYHKKFLIIGNQNAVTYKEIFPLIKDNKIWYGQSISSGDRKFFVPDSYPLYAANCGDDNGRKFVRVKGVRWFTNLDVPKRHDKLKLWKTYLPEKYPKYDNYDAINVDKVKDIPFDYEGIIGVPVTFLDKYNPEQFEILGDSRYHDGSNIANDINILNGKKLYRRLLIRRIKNEL